MTERRPSHGKTCPGALRHVDAERRTGNAFSVERENTGRMRGQRSVEVDMDARHECRRSAEFDDGREFPLRAPALQTATPEA